MPDNITVQINDKKFMTVERVFYAPFNLPLIVTLFRGLVKNLTRK